MKRVVSAILAVVITAALCVAAQARLVGDVDGNGKVTSNDALQILLYSVGQINTIDKNAADTDGDGKINSSDALDVLRICVGSYNGELEIDDKPVTNFKETIIDPIMAMGKYTLKTTVESDGKSIPTTLEVSGNNIAATMETGVAMRILILNGKTYAIFPNLKVYSELDTEVNLDTGASDSKYLKSENVTVDGKECICETYQGADNTTTKYYFCDSKWIMMETVNDGQTSKKIIDDFYAGVSESSFSLSGLVKIDSALLEKYM